MVRAFNLRRQRTAAMLTLLLCCNAAQAVDLEADDSALDNGSSEMADDAASDAAAKAASTAPGQIVAPSADETTREVLVGAWRGLGDDYVARTEHFLENGAPKYINRLVREASPYLLQHAHNPVDWYPWGEEAFAAALAADKPVFLSIGYATCHWCHVMERESFENEAIAAFLNEHFVAIKVDREQHPDVDALYMTAVQLITGGGGWPMSSFLATDGSPFFGGTYYPPEPFLDLLGRVAQTWDTHRPDLLEYAASIGVALAGANRLTERTREVGESEIVTARDSLLSREDRDAGGFGGAPKFPQESSLLFLLDQARRAGGGPALAAADRALERMAAGGIHDQIGGGFHRYSVDAEWQVPHFEKMLYNQASLARAYALGWQLTGSSGHLEVLRGILDYVLRDMTSDEDLFYSATDADSEGREGAYFVWTRDTLAAALGNGADAELAAVLWGVDGFGNFEGGEASVLHRPEALDVIARELELSPKALASKHEELAGRLLGARAEREPPLRDEKILTGWNGLMITAFAEAAAALPDELYLAAARRAADALWASAWDETTRSLRRSRYRGEAALDARQTDYAWLAEAMLALYDADSDARWLERARVLTDTMIENFLDAAGGGFFLGAESVSGARLVTRPKDIVDASTPSGNGVALRLLSRLATRTGDRRYAEEAERLVEAFAGVLTQQRGGQASLLTGLAEHLGGETGPLRYAGRGVARMRGRQLGDGRVEVTFDLADGWHVNSNAPLQDYLIPTRLTDTSGAELGAVRYPAAVERSLAFQDATLSLFEGRVVLTAELPPNAAGMAIAPVVVQLQTCSDEICLAPETLELDVSVAVTR